jgi:disulfide bond formation protein DsbB
VSGTTQTVSAGLAGLALLTQIVLVGLAVLWLAARVLSPARRALAWLRGEIGGGELWIAAIFALVATGGSLYFSEVAHFVPCRLCWYQRIAMYPLLPLLAIAALRKDFRGGSLYALPLAVIGAGVSIYHIYIENNPEAESAGCRAGASCATKWIEELGYITIPTLALTAFLAIIVLSVTALRRERA